MRIVDIIAGLTSGTAGVLQHISQYLSARGAAALPFAVFGVFYNKGNVNGNGKQ